MNKDLLKHCRLLCNYSQTELGSTISVHQTLIGKMENGDIPVQPDTLRKLLNAFADKGIDTEEIALLATVFEAKNKRRRR